MHLLFYLHELQNLKTNLVNQLYQHENLDIILKLFDYLIII
jgi:hypothetical protein